MTTSPWLYPFGWIVTPHGVGVPDADELGWQQIDVGPWNLRHDPRLEVSVLDTVDGHLALLGYALSPDLMTSSHQAIAAWLSEAAGDDTEFQQRADLLLGRFVVMRAQPQSLRIQQDAVGLRDVFHTDSLFDPVAGSHASLVAAAVGAPVNALARQHFFRDTGLRAMPGRMTSRLGVLIQVPNTELELWTRRTHRIFPRSRHAEAPVDQVLDEIDMRVSTGLGLLVDRGRPVYVALSAGFDSRVTLALCRPLIDRLQFYTYDIGYNEKIKANLHDTDTAEQLAAHLGLDHTTLRIDDPAVPAEFRAALNANRAAAHSAALALAYTQHFAAGATLVRSNTSEIVTAYHLSSGFPDQPITPAFRMDIASRYKCQDLHVRDAFADMSLASEFDKVAGLGYDSHDFHHWEYRVGVWLSNVVQESDVASETAIPLNSRRVYDLFLSLTRSDRGSARAQLELIHRHWPSVLDLPVNGRDMSGIDPATAAWEPMPLLPHARRSPTSAR